MPIDNGSALQTVDPDSPEGLGAAASPSLVQPDAREPLSRRKIIETAVVLIDENDLRI